MDAALHLVDELVTDAVKATGSMEEAWKELTRFNFITVFLLALHDGLRIEVWDCSPNLPARPHVAGSHVKRGCYPAARGGVVWAELPILPQGRQPSPYPRVPGETFG